MSSELTRRIDLTATPKPADTVSSRLMKMGLEDAFKSMFGKDEKPAVSGPPRVLLASANYARKSSRDYVKDLMRKLYAAGAQQMKFAFWGADNEHGVRDARITRDWSGDADTMGGLMDRSECNCGGCYILIHGLLRQAVLENQEQPMRAVILVADSFHDTQDNLDEAAISIRQLQREGTKVILLAHGDDRATASKLEHLARMSGAAFFPFGLQQEKEFLDMWAALATFVAGGEEAVRAKGGPAAQLLLEHCKAEPMAPIESPVDTREQVRVPRGSTR